MRLKFPLIYAAPDEPATGGTPAETPAAASAAAAPVVEPVAPETPAIAPWSKDLEERFTDESVRAQVDQYLREKQAPYITRLEQERAAALDKSWVFDAFNDDPAAALAEIAPQVWPELADQLIAVVSGTFEEAEAEAAAAGATPEEAAAAGAAAADEIDLTKLPKEVREAVEFAQAEQARKAAEAASATEQEQLDAASAEYEAWYKPLLVAQPDIIEGDLHAYVYAAEGDMAQGLANYRAAHPAPAGAPAPPTVGGRSHTGIEPERRVSSLGDAFGAVFDAAERVPAG